MIRRAALLLIVAALLIGGLWYSQQRHEPLKVSGVIEADEIRLGSRVGGRVASVHTEEGEDVEPGKLLVELDPFDLLERRAEAAARAKEAEARHQMLTSGFRQEDIDQAHAKYEQLTAELEKLEHGPRQQEIDTARANVELANAERVLAQEVFDRTKGLFDEDAASQDQLDRARKGLEAAQARVRAEQEQLNLLLEGTRKEDIDAARARQREAKAAWDLARNGYREEEIAQAYAAMNAASAALGVIDRQIAELEIKAPVAGTVQAIELRPGDLFGPNAPVISLLDTNHLWVRAFVPENELDISLGQRVRITVDSYPDEAFIGEITFISHEAEFTPRNVQTPEERSKQVFRIKVTLTEGLDRLRAGMAADVWLEEP